MAHQMVFEMHFAVEPFVAVAAFEGSFSTVLRPIVYDQNTATDCPKWTVDAGKMFAIDIVGTNELMHLQIFH